MIRRSAVYAIEIGLGLSAAMLVAGGVLVWRLAQGPIELSALEPRIERALSGARDGRPVEIDRVELVWGQDSHTFELRARDVSLKDVNGQALGAPTDVAIAIDPLHLLIGRVSVSRAAFDGGELSIVLAEDGTARLALGPPGSTPDFILPAPPPDETMRQRVNRVLDGLSAALRPVGPGGRLRQLSISNADLTVVDERHDARFTADGASLAISRDGATMALSFAARLEGPRGPAPFALTVTTDPQFSAAEIDFSVQDARPRMLLPPGTMGALSSLDAPTTATIRAGLDRAAGLTSLNGDISLGAGSATFAGGNFAISGARIAGRYDDDSDVLVLEDLAINGTRTVIQGGMHLRNASRLFSTNGQEAANFDLDLPMVSLEVPGVFAAPVTARQVAAVGTLSLARNELSLQRLRFGVDEATVNLQGNVIWHRDAAGVLRPGLDVTGTIEGALQARSIVSFWPIGLGQGARTYLDEGLQAGTLQGANFKARITPEMFGRALPNDAIDLTFGYADVAMRYVPTMTPLTAARGQGRLQGNAFSLTVEGGAIGQLAVTNGSVLIPRLHPKGAPATIALDARGQARELVGLLQQEPIGVGDRLPVIFDSITGTGAVRVELRRPMLSHVPYEDLRFSVSGAFADVGGRSPDREVEITDWDMAVSGDQNAIRLNGPMLVNASRVNLDWTESLRPGEATPSRIRLTGDFEAQDLDRLGYPATFFADGILGLDVRALGRGFDVDTGTVAIDLRQAQFRLPGEIWTKPTGQAASASFQIDRVTEGGVMLSEIGLTGEGVRLAGGTAQMNVAGDLMRAQFPRLSVGDHVDAMITTERRPDQVMAIAVTGRSFDARPYLNAAASASDDATASQAGAARTAPVQRYALTVHTDRLRMQGNQDLNEVAVTAALRDDVLVAMTATAKTDGGAPVRLAMGPRAADPTGGIDFAAADAGLALRALTGADTIDGGQAVATGVWRPGRVANADFNVRIENFRVARAPAMAQLLSTFASLRGIADTLGGEGIAFTELEAPLQMRGTRLLVGDSRAAGPALGFTANGSFDMSGNDLDIDGVVVPSYGLNSMWGHVPIVGDLLVSRRGEGIVGITFSMNGPVEKAQVGVNPLSVLAPGIFRRIFEPLPASRTPASAGNP
ncbi:MAG: DUF3971 domain-containing protein [Caulobacterales bacterium]